MGLRRSETVEGALVRVVGEQLDVVDAALGAEPESMSLAVHEARRTLKKVRALLRLVASGDGPQILAAPLLELRDAGRAIAALRDADVLVQTVAAAAAELFSPLGPEAFATLEASLRDERDRLFAEAADARPAAAAARHVAAARVAIEAWKPGDVGFTLIREGLRVRYGRARKAMDAACGGISVKAFHKWRLRSKDVRHHVEFLAPMAAELEAMAGELHRLTDFLGDANDLRQLEAAARRSGVEEVASEDGPLGLVAEKRRSLWSEACSLGQVLYAREPADYVGKLEACWDRWVGEETVPPGGSAQG